MTREERQAPIQLRREGRRGIEPALAGDHAQEVLRLHREVAETRRQRGRVHHHVVDERVVHLRLPEPVTHAGDQAEAHEELARSERRLADRPARRP